MMIDMEQIVTINEANQNFFRAARIADEHGEALLVQGNRPKYKLVNLELEPDLELTDDEKIEIIAARVMKRFKPAFMELAKC